MCRVGGRGLCREGGMLIEGGACLLSYTAKLISCCGVVENEKLTGVEGSRG